MRSSLRWVLSSLAALTLLEVGGSIRHPYPCSDCFEPHGFPFTYRQDGGFGVGAAFFWAGLVGDLVVLTLLTGLIWWLWCQMFSRRYGRK